MRVRPMPKVLSRSLAVVFAAALLPHSARAQVGFASNVSQVALVVRANPHAAIRRVAPLQETARQGSTTQASVNVSVTANAACRLSVVGTPMLGRDASRVSVRSLNGEYEAVTPGSAITVARCGGMPGQLDLKVDFRVESAGPDGLNELPVRYEIAVNPTI